jgi:phosphonate transport system substrate-binding protein
VARSPLRFGVSLSHGGSRLEEGTRLFSAALEAELRAEVSVIAPERYDELLGQLLEGAVDLAWMPPLVHSRACAKGAALAAVVERRGALSYRSALLVRADSPLGSVADLVVARAAWTDPSSASGYLFPLLHLSVAGVGSLKRQSFVGSATRACAAVASGEADVCASFVSAAADEPARAQAEIERTLGELGKMLRVLAVTQTIPPDGLVLAESVERDQCTRIREALLTLHAHEAGSRALEVLLQAQRLLPIDNDVRVALSRLRTQVALGFAPTNE